MVRFRRSGTNWEGRKWKTSNSLNALMDEIEAAFPGRHAADGTAASRGHDRNNPRSDHRPYPYSGPGVVNAVDAGEVKEDDGIALAEAIRASRDGRIKYVIHERRIFSSYPHANGAPWTWRPYSGYNAHLSHVHVSVNRGSQNDGSPYNLGLGGEEDVTELIKAIQTALNEGGFTDQNGNALVVDGVLGAKTQHALNSQAKAAAESGLSIAEVDQRIGSAKLVV